MAIPTVKFNKNGKLKIMHSTDTHLDHDNIDMSLFLINWACKKEMPDVAVITGDNVHNDDNAEVTKSYIDRLMRIFDDLSIPVARHTDKQQRCCQKRQKFFHNIVFLITKK